MQFQFTSNSSPNSIQRTTRESACHQLRSSFDINLEELYQYESEEALNLKGEWTTSLLESLATLEIPSLGYGIRYSLSD